jgi:hypothetical protein
MRKTIILAAVTEIIAVIAVVTSLIRIDAVTPTHQVSAVSASQAQTTNAMQTVKIFDAI